jgi:hypothetical protein
MLLSALRNNLYFLPACVFSYAFPAQERENIEVLAIARALAAGV